MRSVISSSRSNDGDGGLADDFCGVNVAGCLATGDGTVSGIGFQGGTQQ